MSPDDAQNFDLISARRAAEAGAIEAWVYLYLAGGPWANPGLSEGLRRERRWWRGPLAVPCGQLVRCCGPEPEMEYRMEPEAWAQRVGTLAAALTTLEAVPPLIVEYRGGVLSVCDGNHRLAAMERRGWARAWVLVWYNHEADALAHSQQLGIVWSASR